MNSHCRSNGASLQRRRRALFLFHKANGAQFAPLVRLSDLWPFFTQFRVTFFLQQKVLSLYYVSTKLSQISGYCIQIQITGQPFPLVEQQTFYSQSAHPRWRFEGSLASGCENGVDFFEICLKSLRWLIVFKSGAVPAHN
jgi:hypothetical protein